MALDVHRTAIARAEHKSALVMSVSPWSVALLRAGRICHDPHAVGQIHHPDPAPTQPAAMYRIPSPRTVPVHRGPPSGCPGSQQSYQLRIERNAKRTLRLSCARGVREDWVGTSE